MIAKAGKEGGSILCPRKTTFNICIYCRSELPATVPREHVIPQSFGVFTPDLTLDCVCKTCNHYFGSKLEWPMLNQSIEGALRLQFGLKGVVGGVGTKASRPRLPKETTGKAHERRSEQIRTGKNGRTCCRKLELGDLRLSHSNGAWLMN